MKHMVNAEFPRLEEFRRCKPKACTGRTESPPQGEALPPRRALGISGGCPKSRCKPKACTTIGGCRKFRSGHRVSGVLAIGLVLACVVTAQDGREDRVAVLQRAAKLIDRSDLTGAEAALKPLLRGSPRDAIAVNLLGIVRLRQGDNTEAEHLFLEAAKTEPRLAGPHVNLGLLYGPDRAGDAIAQFGQALKLSPQNSEAQSALRATAEKAALNLARAGDKKGAVGIMLEACNALPHDPELLYQFALAAMDAGLFADGREALEESLRLRADQPDAIYALARAYLGEGKGQQAEEQLRRYLALRPSDASAQYGLGYVLVSEQKLDQARAAFERSLELQPEQTESVFQLGLIDARTGNNDAARERFEKVLARDPHHAGALTEKAVLAFREHRYDDSAALLQTAIASAPGYEKAHYYLALTLARLGRKQESERELQVAASLKKGPAKERLLALPQ